MILKIFNITLLNQVILDMTTYTDEDRKYYIDYYIGNLWSYPQYITYQNTIDSFKDSPQQLNDEIDRQITTLIKENLFIVLDDPYDATDIKIGPQEVKLSEEYWMINHNNILITDSDANRPHPNLFCMMAHDSLSSNDEHFAVVYWTTHDSDSDSDSDSDLITKQSILAHPYFIERNKDENERLHISVDNFDDNLDPYGGAFICFDNEINTEIVEKLIKLKNHE